MIEPLLALPAHLRERLIRALETGQVTPPYAEVAVSNALVRRFADRLWGKDWPGQRQPEVFYDPRSLDPDAPGAVLHAKAIVADEEVAFVTSANLTEAAFDRNIELGILSRDRMLAA